MAPNLSGVDILQAIKWEWPGTHPAIIPCTWKGQKDVAMVEERCRLDQVMRRKHRADVMKTAYTIAYKDCVWCV